MTRFPRDVAPHDLGMADVGEKVRFLDANGYETELKYAREILKKGEVLTVNAVSIGGWSSSYRFDEIGSQWLNTVMFEPVGAQ